MVVNRVALTAEIGDDFGIFADVGKDLVVGLGVAPLIAGEVDGVDGEAGTGKAGAFAEVRGTEPVNLCAAVAMAVMGHGGEVGPLDGQSGEGDE